MKFKIITSKHCEIEFKALEYFLSWQRVSLQVIQDDNQCLKITSGRPSPCVFTGDSLYSIGFMDTLRKFELDGLLLC